MMAYDSDAYQLTNLLQDMYLGLGLLNIYPATGGTTGTAVIGLLAGKESRKDGVLFVVDDAAGAAPIGEYSRISGYTRSSGTFAIGTLTAAIASGDTVGIASNTMPIELMVELANQTLQSLGQIDLVDTTTLNSAEEQREYTCSVIWKKSGMPTRVDIQTNVDSNDNQWEEIKGWQFIPATVGSTGLIILPTQPTPSRDIRVWYKDKHPRIDAFDDQIHNFFNPELVKNAAVMKSFQYLVAKKKNDPALIQLYNDWKDTSMRSELNFSPKKPYKARPIVPSNQ